MVRRALTREVSPAIANCELTHLDRTPVDAGRARRQHEAYTALLADLGCTVTTLPADPDLPDSVFVEDCAVVLDDFAILTRPGAPSRRPEVDAVAAALGEWLPLRRMEGPGTLDGGDVLRLGRNVFVGQSDRTGPEGLKEFAALAAGTDLEVRPVPLLGALHLKTAVTALGPDAVVLNPHWVDPAHFAGFRIVEAHPAEPFGANVLVVGGTVVVAAAHPRTAERCASVAGDLRTVEADELARAEGGLTCCSILVEVDG